MELRNGSYTRKPMSWSECVGYNLIDGNEDGLRALPRFKAYGGPGADFQGERPQFFVMEVGTGFYLVNSEGASYARYAARLPAILFA